MKKKTQCFMSAMNYFWLKQQFDYYYIIKVQKCSVVGMNEGHIKLVLNVVMYIVPP